RPEAEVLHPLQGLTPRVLSAAAPENTADLRAFLARELNAFASGSIVPATVLDRLVTRSEGVFLYAEWLRRELGQGRLTLDQWEKFPQGLGGVYAQFFQRQFPKAAAYRQRIRPVLDVIVAAFEPLEVGLIADLFGWVDRDRKRFQGSLSALFPVRD